MGGDSASEQAEVVRTLFELMDAGRTEQAASLVAENALNHGRPGGRAQSAAIYASLAEAFPDERHEIQLLVAEGEWVAVRVLATGTHLGTPSFPYVLGGILADTPPTGRTFAVAHHHFFRVVDGQILEHWAAREDLEMARQLGLLPHGR
jgi:predicted ester cyclase